MPATWYDCLHLRQRPRWDEGGGDLYVKQGAASHDVPTAMYRHRPRIPDICASLLGVPVRINGEIVGVRYPRLDTRLRVYREGIELIVVFRDYEELITLAMYRRQVTRRGGIPLDLLFFNLACEAGFTGAQWQQLAERMPDRAPIRAACLHRAAVAA